MIEVCTRKRMVIAILLVFSISVITLVLESRWSTQHHIKKVKNLTKPARVLSNETCQKGEEVVKEACTRCTEEQMHSKNYKKFCPKTGFIEVIDCEEGPDIFRSCALQSWDDEQHFWIFEGVTLATGLCSYFVVRFRQRHLDNQVLDKINKQIAAGI